ncbi:MAG: hypothetical protein ABWY01_00440 [Pseudoxanthomonas sp.]
MKPVTLSALITAAVALGLPWSQPVGATSGIQRCEAGDGSVIYTDRACPALGSKPLPVPAGLLTRIAAEEARYADSNAPLALGLQADASPAPDANARADTGPVGRRAPQSGCARSKQQLVTDMRGSFALHNVNRLAESYHWVGKSNRQAQQQMLQLERMATLSLQQATFFDGFAGGGLDEASAVDAGGLAGTLQLTLAKGASLQVVDLDVTRYAGCYFARL